MVSQAVALVVTAGAEPGVGAGSRAAVVGQGIVPQVVWLAGM